MGIEEFVSSIAEPNPSIAGGHVAAYVGSFAAALGEMMAGLTEGRPSFVECESRIQQIHQELSNIRHELQLLAGEDSAAMQSVLKARRLLRGVQEERASYAQAAECAIKDATRIPLKLARLSFQVLELLRTLIDLGNPNVKADAAIGAQFAFASLKAGQYNVLTNAREIKDKAFAKSCRTESAELIQRALEIIRQIDLKILDS
jgi:methenyltetrahydrofolate cyclohydrolase